MFPNIFCLPAGLRIIKCPTQTIKHLNGDCTFSLERLNSKELLSLEFTELHSPTQIWDYFLIFPVEIWAIIYSRVTKNYNCHEFLSRFMTS